MLTQKHLIITNILTNPTSQKFYLIDIEMRSMDFLDNVNVPEHQKIKRSEKHLKEVELFNKALSNQEINKNLLFFHQINKTSYYFFAGGSGITPMMSLIIRFITKNFAYAPFLFPCYFV